MFLGVRACLHVPQRQNPAFCLFCFPGRIYDDNISTRWVQRKANRKIEHRHCQQSQGGTADTLLPVISVTIVITVGMIGAAQSVNKKIFFPTFHPKSNILPINTKKLSFYGSISSLVIDVQSFRTTVDTSELESPHQTTEVLLIFCTNDKMFCETPEWLDGLGNVTRSYIHHMLSSKYLKFQVCLNYPFKLSLTDNIFEVLLRFFFFYPCVTTTDHLALKWCLNILNSPGKG